jgi:hypothetical protein
MAFKVIQEDYPVGLKDSLGKFGILQPLPARYRNFPGNCPAYAVGGYKGSARRCKGKSVLSRRHGMIHTVMTPPRVEGIGVRKVGFSPGGTDFLHQEPGVIVIQVAKVSPLPHVKLDCDEFIFLNGIDKTGRSYNPAELVLKVVSVFGVQIAEKNIVLYYSSFRIRWGERRRTAVLSLDKPNLRLDNKIPAEEGNSTCGGNK